MYFISCPYQRHVTVCTFIKAIDQASSLQPASGEDLDCSSKKSEQTKEEQEKETHRNDELEEAVQ